MFGSLRDAFRQAVDNFRTELNRDAVPEAADQLLRAMKRELVEVQERTRRLDEEIAAVRDEAVAEEREARVCVRREELAREIGDDETARIAREFAMRHLRRHAILTRKSEVLGRELAEHRQDLDEMIRRYRDARERKAAITAATGRTGARERIRQADGLFAEMDRMEEKVRDLEHRAEAAREVGEALEEDSGAVPGSDADSVDERLAQLKRRMNPS